MRILRDLVLVAELQDAEHVHAPDGVLAFDWPETEQSEPCVGVVEQVGPKAIGIEPGQTVIFHPYAGYSSFANYRVLPAEDIVGWIRDGELIPKDYSVVVDPDWSGVDRTRSGLIILPREHIPLEPRTKGTVVRTGRGITTLLPGDKVLIPPGLAGYEVGFKNHVYYIIPEADILAIIVEDSNA